MTDTNLTQDEIFFTNAFNAQRMTLAGFATCSSREELHIVRDGFYLSLASDLNLDEYDPVREAIVTNESVAEAVKSTTSFQTTVEVARKSPHWDDLMKAVKAMAASVGSNLEEIWETLEKGRLEWLAAASAAHGIKTMLKSALDNQCGGAMDGDISDAKMIWIYSLARSIPSLLKEAEAWRMAVGMNDGTRPFVGYNQNLWDPRKLEWAPLDRGMQEAAERGGSSITEAWSL
mmetsp:Transcript_9143/g.13831  ORF Transcript_9143/g.13831 Transcript_9143/m.13831 type:complete len:232 (+) Transcript_9143:89-784(+)